MCGTGCPIRSLAALAAQVWQLITGYTLRELEAKQELNKLLDS